MVEGSDQGARVPGQDFLVVDHPVIFFEHCLHAQMAVGREKKMSKLLRGVVAGAGAWKWGGGCLSTIFIFLILWWILGSFGIFR